MQYLIFFAGLISFLVVFVLTPILIRYLKKIGLEVKDQNKDGKPLVPISGGIAVLAGIFAGLLLFIFFATFFSNSRNGFILDEHNLMLLFAAMCSLLIITIVGFLDDVIIRKDKESSAGLRQWQKPLLTLCAAIPLMVVSAGVTKMTLPFIFTLDFGIFYPLVLVPIAVVGCSNMVNMLGGYNGMEAGMGIIYTGFLSVYSYFHGTKGGALISFFAFCSLLAFFYYNKSPAKILPGDSLTYLLGAVMAVVAIIGNIERAAIIMSIPFFIEFILKFRSKFKAQSYGYYLDGKVKVDSEKIYSLPHILARTGKYTEKQITYSLIIVEVLLGLIIWVV